ncbi:hypothetical protein TNCV_545661 [Trichonephila clavipes]|nr:hypothetical protein TNCV_545661 [Trichonephila clavipes]
MPEPSTPNSLKMMKSGPERNANCVGRKIGISFSPYLLLASQTAGGAFQLTCSRQTKFRRPLHLRFQESRRFARTPFLPYYVDDVHSETSKEPNAPKGHEKGQNVRNS